MMRAIGFYSAVVGASFLVLALSKGLYPDFLPATGLATSISNQAQVERNLFLMLAGGFLLIEGAVLFGASSICDAVSSLRTWLELRALAADARRDSPAPSSSYGLRAHRD